MRRNYEVKITSNRADWRNKKTKFITARNNEEALSKAEKFRKQSTQSISVVENHIRKSSDEI